MRIKAEDGLRVQHFGRGGIAMMLEGARQIIDAQIGAVLALHEQRFQVCSRKALYPIYIRGVLECRVQQMRTDEVLAAVDMAV